MRAPFSLFSLFPFLSLGRLVGLALLLPALALAQNPPPHALAGAADPAAPTAHLAYQGIPPGPVNAQDGAPQDWRAAHAAVDAFPRGHADILAWEAAQAAAGTPPMHPPHAGERQP